MGRLCVRCGLFRLSAARPHLITSHASELHTLTLTCRSILDFVVASSPYSFPYGFICFPALARFGSFDYVLGRF